MFFVCHHLFKFLLIGTHSKAKHFLSCVPFRFGGLAQEFTHTSDVIKKLMDLRPSAYLS